MSAETTSIEPVGKLAALRERWALLRAKLSTWWADNTQTAAWLAAMGTLLLLALVFAAWWLKDPYLEQPPAADQAQPVAAQTDDATAVAAQQPAHNAPAAPQRRTAARPMPAPQPLPQAAPTGWGTTDLDRAIADFDPATATAAPKAITTTTTGAQP